MEKQYGEWLRAGSMSKGLNEGFRESGNGRHDLKISSFRGSGNGRSKKKKKDFTVEIYYRKFLQF